MIRFWACYHRTMSSWSCTDTSANMCASTEMEWKRCQSPIVASLQGHISGLILGLHPASERRCYKVNTVSHWLGANLESPQRFPLHYMKHSRYIRTLNTVTLVIVGLALNGHRPTHVSTVYSFYNADIFYKKNSTHYSDAIMSVIASRSFAQAFVQAHI